MSETLMLIKQIQADGLPVIAEYSRTGGDPWGLMLFSETPQGKGRAEARLMGGESCDVTNPFPEENVFVSLTANGERFGPWRLLPGGTFTITRCGQALNLTVASHD